MLLNLIWPVGGKGQFTNCIGNGYLCQTLFVQWHSSKLGDEVKNAHSEMEVSVCNACCLLLFSVQLLHDEWESSVAMCMVTRPFQIGTAVNHAQY